MLAVSGVFVGILQPMDESQDMEHFRLPIYIKNDVKFVAGIPLVSLSIELDSKGQRGYRVIRVAKHQLKA
jgi:hypothetical protein